VLTHAPLTRCHNAVGSPRAPHSSLVCTRESRHHGHKVGRCAHMRDRRCGSGRGAPGRTAPQHRADKTRVPQGSQLEARGRARMIAGRTKRELGQAATRVRIRDAILDYRRKIDLPKEYSYSLETGVAYDVAERGSRMALLDSYSDGQSPLYMIAVTHVQETISEDRAVLAAMDCVTLGRVPFLGRWVSDGVVYEDVSFAADHGITDKGTAVLLRKLKQKAALKITHDGYRVMFSLGSHGVSYGT